MKPDARTSATNRSMMASFAELPFSTTKRLVDVEKAVGKRTQLRSRCGLCLERPLPVDREGVNTSARQQRFQLGLRRHGVEHAYSRVLQPAADEQLLRLSLHGTHGQAGAIDVSCSSG